MTALVVPGSTLWLPNTVPTRLAINSATGTSLDVSFAPEVGGSGALLLGFDLTATQANPVQIFAFAYIQSSAYFYWDSQSTGEGNGVTFAWRGQLPILAGETLHCGMTASSSITLGGVIWGLRGQLRTTVND